MFLYMMTGPNTGCFSCWWPLLGLTKSAPRSLKTIFFQNMFYSLKAHAHYFTIIICLAPWRADKLGICTHFTSINLPQCSQSIKSLMYVYYTNPHLFYECLILVVITSSYYHCPRKNCVLPPGCMIYIQGFPNIVKEWGESEILLGEIIFTGWREPEEEWFWRCKPFFKA